MLLPYSPAGVLGASPPMVSTLLYHTWSGRLFSSLHATLHDEQPMQRRVSTTMAYLVMAYSTFPSHGCTLQRLSKNEQFTA